MPSDHQSPIFDTLSTAISDGTARIAVIGLGYVGLPLVRTLVEADFSVIGFDTDQQKIQTLQSGESYIRHIPAEWIKATLAGGRFTPSHDMSRLCEADVVIICVPTPLSPDRNPDLTYVQSTAREIARYLRAGQLVILESTTYPSTTREVVLPLLQESNLKCGEDFFLAYSPEREDPGNPQFTTRRIPKVVGAFDQVSLELAQLLYGKVVVEVIPVSSMEVAEACKILENTYRAVNIALVNELKVLFEQMGIDIWEVIAAASTKPFGFAPFYPGPGLGGHCIPIDPFYLSWLARQQGLSAKFVELAGEVNASMPDYVVSRVTQTLAAADIPVAGSKVAIIGIAYKKDVDDPRESPAFRIMELLMEQGANLSYHDPYIPTLPSMRHYRVPNLACSELTSEFLAAQDCVVIVTDHSTYDWQFIVDHAQRVVDTRNATANVLHGRQRITRA